VLPYVDARHLVDYIRSAAAGVIPLLHAQIHEVALCNNYFQCMHAGLQMVVSDVKLQAESVRRPGIGEVFTAGDVASFTAATRAVLADRERYLRSYAQPGLLDCYSWEAQVPTLLDSYARATPGRDLR
jgi:glycogen(starch) synthase